MGKKADKAYAEGFVDGVEFADASNEMVLAEVDAYAANLAMAVEDIALGYAYDLARLEDAYRTYLLDGNYTLGVDNTEDVERYLDVQSDFYAEDQQYRPISVGRW